MLLFCSPATCKPPAFEKTLAPEFVCGALGREVVVPTRLTSLAYQMVVTSSCVPLQLMPKPMNTVPSNSRVLVMSISVYSQLVLAPFSRLMLPSKVPPEPSSSKAPEGSVDQAKTLTCL